MIKTDVLIIGAGPTGLALACQLLKYKIDFQILDIKDGITTLSKAMVVHARSMEVFDEMGLAETFESEGQPMKNINIMSSGEIAERLQLNKFGMGLTKFPYLLTLEQSKTEKILYQHLVENNIVVNWNTQLLNYENNKDGVSALLKDTKGNTQSIQSRYIIGCDGAKSQIRHQMNISFEGSTIERTFYVADVAIKSDVINKKEGFINVIKNGFVLIFGMPETDRFRIIGVLSDEEAAVENISFEDIKNTIKEQVTTPLTFKREFWFATYKVHSRMASTFIQNKAILAGDACHIHTPAGGQGMNTGIQDAYNLAWKLAYVLNGKANESILNSYNIERVANAKNLLQTTDTQFDFMVGENMFVNFIKMHIFPHVAKLVTNTKFASKRAFLFLSQLAIKYPQSPLTITSKMGDIEAGDRFPYFELTNGENIYDKLNSQSFKLLYFGAKGDSMDLDNLPFASIYLKFNETPKCFGDNTNFYVYVRPDNHISYLGRELEELNVLNKQESSTPNK